jgi:DNA-directed RNA polymerase sigma subunit (sigma70/sigma32)
MARFDKLRKLNRNALVIRYRAEHPDLSLEEIGEAFNISGGRVWQICNPGFRSKKGR